MVFTTMSSINPLVDSVIHNSGAIESISNNFDHIEDFVSERIQIQGFGGITWAKGRGIIVVWATALEDKEKSQELRIHNALYCLDGPTSLILGRALNWSNVFKTRKRISYI